LCLRHGYGEDQADDQTDTHKNGVVSVHDSTPCEGTETFFFDTELQPTSICLQGKFSTDIENGAINSVLFTPWIFLVRLFLETAGLSAGFGWPPQERDIAEHRALRLLRS
jgi:hypothetical protein